jgi:hypothetical protein
MGGDVATPTSGTPTSTGEPKITQVTESSHTSPVTPIQDMTNENFLSSNTIDFKDFVDNYVRSTTKFKSAIDLLNGKVPLRYAWVSFGLLTVIGFLGGGPLGALLLGGILGFLTSHIAGLIIRFRYTSKTAGKFNKEIDIDDLIRFLNTQLSYLHPHLHKWGYFRQEGIGVRGIVATEITNSLKEKLQEVSLCSTFGEKQKYLSVIHVRPDPSNRASGEMEYLFEVEKNGISWALGFQHTICLFKATPILQAAMEYYQKINLMSK